VITNLTINSKSQKEILPIPHFSFPMAVPDLPEIMMKLSKQGNNGKFHK
jgi:hypothetical protein